MRYEKRKSETESADAPVLEAAAAPAAVAANPGTGLPAGFQITCRQCSSMNVAVETSTLGDLTITCATCGQKGNR